MQTKLEQAFKEYIEFKYYVDNNKKSAEEIREEISKMVVKEGDENYLDIMFELYGEKQLETIDLNQLQTKLYHYYNLVKDMVEVPEEIKKEAEKLDVKSLFTIKNGKKEIVDKELYNSYKNQFIEVNKQAMTSLQ